MPGERDPLYVLARRTLLDALEALQAHRNSIILVGAQAIYLHTGESDLAVAPFTSDADLALDPMLLATEPALEQAMLAADFLQQDQPGIWTSQRSHTTVDLLVPELLGGSGRRGARLDGHSQKAARKARGLEAAIIDHQQMPISSLEAGDPRQIETKVAGPAALLIAKLHKIAERQDDARRRHPKDALDVYRILQAISTKQLAESFTNLRTMELTTVITAQAIQHLHSLFCREAGIGLIMLEQAVGVLDDPEVVTASCLILAQDLFNSMQDSEPVS